MTVPLRTLTESVDHLTEESHLVRDELIKIRAEMERKNKRFALVLAAVTLLLACTVVAAFQVTLDNRQAIQQSERRWCPLLLTIGPRPGAPAPAGNAEQQEYARKTRQLIADLAEGSGCR